MAETLREEKSPEQRVFGEAFSLNNGVADEATQKVYFEERVASVVEGKTTWLSRTMDGERGIVADLYKGRKIVATLHFDYDVLLTSVYTKKEGGSLGDNALCDEVTFDNAVAEAEKFAGNLS